MQPTDQPTPAKDRKVDYVMLGIYGFLALLFCCGGAVFTGVMGADSERQGMEAAMVSAGPGCCACSGFLTVLLGMFAFKGRTAKIVAPIVVSIVGGLLGAIGMLLFFEVIWPEL